MFKALITAAALLLTPLLFSHSIASAARPSGGSDTVFEVDRRDAVFTMDNEQVKRLILIEQEIFAELWEGVVEDRIAKLQIGYCEFNIVYDPRRDRILAYDSWGRPYEVREDLEWSDPEVFNAPPFP